MEPIKTILHPTDFSENSASALEVACSLARDRHARLILLHVIPHAPAVFWSDDPVPRQLGEHFEEDLNEYWHENEQKLNDIQITDADISVERHLRKGDVANAIIEAAEEFTCDLIAMGTHGQTGLKHVLMGGVAEEVTRRACCPVLTLSTPSNSYESLGAKRSACLYDA